MLGVIINSYLKKYSEIGSNQKIIATSNTQFRVTKQLQTVTDNQSIYLSYPSFPVVYIN